jgi:hypothetical protein
MELMRNKYLQFDNIELENFGKQVKNFTLIGTLPNIPEKFFTESYVVEKKIDDNMRLEYLSFEIWGDTSYWDILMALNGMTSMHDLPVDYDTILERTEERLLEWRTKTEHLRKNNYNILEVESKREEILNEEIENNEKYRNIKYIEMSNLSELLTELDELKELPKINFNLLINKED